MNELLKLQTDLSQEHEQFVKECGALEQKAEELRENGFIEAIKQSLPQLRNSFIELIRSKIEAKAECAKQHPDQSEYLFQVETKSSKLHVFWIPMKELKTYEVDFKFSLEWVSSTQRTASISVEARRITKTISPNSGK